ncbi:MAG TPA: FoF1 ATP synthase subunit gamma [Candidatus Dependentiae bacterium]|nr:FoF1 ATP synthase subunit gamma [Candidatus Dependentiae bacterium]HRQ62238.1 FoF1 ATP synthase subunit gamma [Candidatus Dependentiae bacterium]
MSKLVHMRQRIKAIETIKKITHAMRLISMSTHSRLKNKQEPMTQYIEHIKTLFERIHTIVPEWHNQLLNPSPQTPTKNLIILIGSQKGLCGNFNSSLFNFFNRSNSPYIHPYDIIVIGKKAVDFIQEVTNGNLIATYPTFGLRNLFTLSQALVDTIIHAPQPYTSVIMVSNKLQGFFVQKPHDTQLIPFTLDHDMKQSSTEEYIWEQNATEILDVIAQQYLEAYIQFTLFQSLYAEYAARFLSMDNSTRNANNLLELTKLEYNKLRQARITQELTELTGSF